MLKLLADDPYLDPFRPTIESYHYHFQALRRSIEKHWGSVYDFANAHQKMGLHYDEQGGKLIFREWAPEAYALYLIGDFNDWNQESHPLQRNNHNPHYWEMELEGDTARALEAGSHYKLLVHARNGIHERLPAYTRFAVQDPHSLVFSAFSKPPQDYPWEVPHFELADPENLCIYEAHVGMATEEGKVGSFHEFRENVLPRIKAAGYNCIQLMAIQEHPYYGSFGYHVSNFFAVSSRFGSPRELKALIDAAHKQGIAVIMDLVHSHAVKNMAEGLNDFDGSGAHYFKPGAEGEHPLWDSKIFDYNKLEVIRFLLSNIRYWLEEFKFDGFRFDGVTSMLYTHHGKDAQFGSYADYFGGAADRNAINYLQLANTLIHTINPKGISIAEDVSGFPGIGMPPEEGGIGFDYRLGMGIPDYWIKLVKEVADEEWNPEEIFWTLSNRRTDEKTITYAESHDQALVGDKTLAFRLMDAAMYEAMAKDQDHHLIDRGLAMLKLIRLLTLSLGGEAYLNFMGNEFGHPEWIDFPREGNNWSYHYARRQWSLAERKDLKYHYLADFDQALIRLARESGWLKTGKADLVMVNNADQVLVYRRGAHYFAINLNPQQEWEDYKTPLSKEQMGEVVLRTQDEAFGGAPLAGGGMAESDGLLSLYLPSRAGIVWKA